jgi:5-formyltetrahydrofolate cyclo-ligase
MKTVSLREEKRKLRQEILARREAIPAAERLEKSQKITQRLLTWPAYQHTRIVLLYAGVRSEVATEELVKKSLAAGKQVLMPRCLPETRQLLLVPISAWEELKPSFYGLLEPPPPAEFNPVQPDLIVVPGVAFDLCGYRLGYGGGYYDRLLWCLNRTTTVGLAFEAQIVPQVPRETHDVPLDFVVTESRFIAGRNGPLSVEGIGNQVLTLEERKE